MYELEYVRKRKRRKAAAITRGVSVVVISALSIVAFLGRHVGVFTVSLDTGKVSLALSQKSSFVTSTSFLRVDELKGFNEYSYAYIMNEGEDIIDSESSDSTYGAIKDEDGTIKSLKFFKYTFYVKNVGDTPAKYTFSLNILESYADTHGNTLDRTLRVAIYDNDASATTHNKKVYAKPLASPALDVDGQPHLDENGNPDCSAPISISEYDASRTSVDFEGYAEQFRTARNIAFYTVPSLNVNQIRRYTIVTWLEGFASEDGSTAPKGASINLGVEINAYEI